MYYLLKKMLKTNLHYLNIHSFSKLTKLYNSITFRILISKLSTLLIKTITPPIPFINVSHNVMSIYNCSLTQEN